MIYHYHISKQIGIEEHSADGVFYSEFRVTDLTLYRQLKKAIIECNANQMPKEFRDYDGWTLNSLSVL